jgi:GntR family transcriptional repressor for pyruvate dehydrogenase complex
VHQILGDVKCGALKPGDKLPSEKRLLEIYKVSRGSVREALRTLKIMNVIDIMQGKGAYVTSLDTGRLIQHLDFIVELDSASVLSLFEARQILEPEMAAMAALRATEEDIADMQKLLDNDYHVDIILHEKIAECTKNPILIRFVSSVYHMGEISREKTSGVPGVVEKVHGQHTALVEAIASRDPERARESMRNHLEFVVSSYRRYLAGHTDSH